MKWFYMSVAGKEGFLGAMVVQAEDERAAHLKAHILGIHPKRGQTLFIAVPKRLVARYSKVADRLLTREDVERELGK